MTKLRAPITSIYTGHIPSLRAPTGDESDDMIYDAKRALELLRIGSGRAWLRRLVEEGLLEQQQQSACYISIPGRLF